MKNEVYIQVINFEKTKLINTFDIFISNPIFTY